ncbi:hypothetical protein PT974_11313 [Cladobotryum mycophilum]|uniref:DUF985 domain-containing protein n=1 Tax=Cladobotryum mycophilum TaxID=491253 RepID=A0ABR0S4U9_9HYPO
MGSIPGDQEHNELDSIRPIFKASSSSSSSPESPRIQSTIKALSLIPHIEGGYYAVTDISTVMVPSPYPPTPLSQGTVDIVGGLQPDFDYYLRRLSTTIFYFLTPTRPQGSFHRNRSRIMHTLHRGRGRYVLIHPDGRVESFIVGNNIKGGEKLQWVVEGGVWKASYLLDAGDGKAGENEGLLISETVVPGFEYADHEFLSRERCEEILPKETAKQLEWLVKH